MQAGHCHRQQVSLNLVPSTAYQHTSSRTARQPQSTCAAISRPQGSGSSCSAVSEKHTRLRAFRLPLPVQLNGLSQLQRDTFWNTFPHIHRQWLEHVWELSHDEQATLRSDAHLSCEVDGFCSSTLQIAEPSSLPRTSSSFGSQPGGDKDPEFYANVGSAIRTLREDIPPLFHKDLTYEIYRPDVVFRDPKNHFSGLRNYKIIFWSLRFHGQLFFSKIYVQINRLWQPDDMTLRMRWTVVGVPRVPWEAQGLFDGISNFKFDKKGKIYEHKVDNVILRDPPLQTPFLAGLNLVFGGERQPVPNMCKAYQAVEKQPSSQAQRRTTKTHLEGRLKRSPSNGGWTTSSKGC